MGRPGQEFTQRLQEEMQPENGGQEGWAWQERVSQEQGQAGKDQILTVRRGYGTGYERHVRDTGMEGECGAR